MTACDLVTDDVVVQETKRQKVMDEEIEVIRRNVSGSSQLYLKATSQLEYSVSTKPKKKKKGNIQKCKSRYSQRDASSCMKLTMKRSSHQ